VKTEHRFPTACKNYAANAYHECGYDEIEATGVYRKVKLIYDGETSGIKNDHGPEKAVDGSLGGSESHYKSSDGSGQKNRDHWARWRVSPPARIKGIRVWNWPGPEVAGWNKHKRKLESSVVRLMDASYAVVAELPAFTWDEIQVANTVSNNDPGIWRPVE
jgi:hypothetical protein